MHHMIAIAPPEGPGVASPLVGPGIISPPVGSGVISGSYNDNLADSPVDCRIVDGLIKPLSPDRNEEEARAW